MKLLVCCTLLALIVSPSALAQTGKPPGGGGNKPSPTRPTTTIPTTPTPTVPGMQTGPVFFSGKVVIDDGSALTEQAEVQTICNGRKRTETYTDSHGSFSFEFGSRSMANMGAGIADADNSAIYGTPMSSTQPRDYRNCELQAYLPGFTSQVVELGGRFFGSESYDVGRVVLHRIAQVQGLTISATTAAAPNAATKAFSKGLNKAEKKKWADAQKLFEKAVEIYPKFAVAWNELGRVQLQQKAEADARHSFEQATAADPSYVSPYRGMTELAFAAHQWTDVVRYTNKVLALNPLNFPDAWFYNSVANFFLQNFPAAANSAEQGIKVDEQHKIPKLEYVLGMALINMKNLQAASEHMQRYLHLAKEPADIAEAQKELATIQRLSAEASVPADKK